VSLPALEPNFEFAIAAATDIGRVRENNEDRLVVGSLDSGRTWSATELMQSCHGVAERGPFAIVCDGMGGAAGGEIASEIAATVAWKEIATTPNTRDAEVFARLLRRALRVASAEVFATAQREGLRGMGSTAAAVAVIADRLVIANVGDSRVYIQRGTALTQVTRDQSLASVMLSAGRSEAEAAVVGGAILQAIGVARDVEPSLSLAQLRRGDRILICSDGLHGLLTDDVINAALGEQRSVDACIDLLINCARVAGGSDNISCILIEVSGQRFLAASDGEQPKFHEFDPQKEGEPALTSTSYVARRLAARVGVDTDPGPPQLPVTGQHRAFVEPTSAPGQRPRRQRDSSGFAGEARRLLSANRLFPWWAYAALVAVAITVTWWILG
jgi:PPM family protein phosphatase